MEDSPLRLFVAMPGTNMGSSTDWNDPEQIKNRFLEPIRESLSKGLERDVELVIEKDKVIGGEIYASMFEEALKADIYMADLTGNNANVYLELGARWASRDAVTIIVSQNVREVLFNASAVRVIPYGKDPDRLPTAIEEVVKAIIGELAKPEYCDSPIRRGGAFVVYDRGFIEQLQSENAHLKKQRGEDLFEAAKAANTEEERLHLLRDAVRINPSRTDILVDIGAELRKQSHYEESVDYLKRAVSLDPHLSDAHRELGVTYGKSGKSELAVDSFNEAVRLAPDDPEALRNSGGALRRWALRDAPSSIDFDALRSARDRYGAAAKREPYDTYALLNVAKLELMISKADHSRLSIAMEQFDKLKPLCEFNVTQSPSDPWRRFDLAESHLFSKDFATSHELYQEGIDEVPQEHCKSYLSSVVNPLHELLALDVLSGDLKTRVEDICRLLEERIEVNSCGG